MTTDARAQGTSFLSLAASDRTPLRALETAAVVGSILVAINQGEAILAGEGVDVLKMGLTYLVPFFVATIQRRLEQARLRRAPAKGAGCGARGIPAHRRPAGANLDRR